MKIRCKTTSYLYFTHGNLYTVLDSTNDDYLVPNDKSYSMWVSKVNFEVIQKTLEEQLEDVRNQIHTSKAEEKRLENLIRERDSVKLGDKFQHKDGSKHIATRQIHNGLSYHTLVMYEKGNSVGTVGMQWSNPTTNIQNIFDGSRKSFTKIN